MNGSCPVELLSCGTVNGARVSSILRDTGCSAIIVSEEVLPDVNLTACKRVEVFDYLGRRNVWPVVRCYISCKFFEGWVNAVRAPIKLCSVLIGNVPGVKGTGSEDGVPEIRDTSEQSVQTVQTRAQRAREGLRSLHPLVVPKLDAMKLNYSEFQVLQKACTSLSDLRPKADSSELVRGRAGMVSRFINKDGLLYRECTQSNYSPNIGKLALVVPSECRKTVLSVAHESLMAGHFSHRKTEQRVRDHFFWPGMSSDIKRFCQSCDKCQRMCPKGRVKSVPLAKMPIITEPFSRVAIDLVGPLQPLSSGGHRYILTLIDFATGFPEAVPLRNIDSISVAEALLPIFARVGIPREILSDLGTQFTSALMGEVHRLLGVKPLFTTPYHPMGNGRIERLHSTLKACLKKLCSDKPRDWHRYLVPTLFAIREIPSDRSGFSAFELLYGRRVRGPMAVLRDLWEDSALSFEERPLFQYVLELRDKLEDCAEIAATNSNLSATRFKDYFDCNSQDRQFAPGDEVLVLLPDSSHKLLMAWSGPHSVLEKRNRVNYLIDFNGKPKLYHANLLKRYHRRAVAGHIQVLDEVSTFSTDPAGGALYLCQCCVVEDYEVNLPDGVEEDLPVSNVHGLDLVEADEIPCFEANVLETPAINPDLSNSQKVEIHNLVREYDCVLSPLPGCTGTIEHEINLITEEPFRAKIYPIPVHLQSHFDKEVDELLRLGIIKPSSSPYCSPVVLVKKPDNSYRLTIDYRALNAVSAFHAEPACSAEYELHKFVGSEYFTEIDITKAYHQIPLTEKSRPLTAFPTSRGLMEYRRMPFGLVTACATYARLMRIVLQDLPNVVFYFDNIYVHTVSWSEHVPAVGAVLQRLQVHGLTARPSKCKFGFKSLDYLGFKIEDGNLSPQEEKVKSISNVPPPRSKKALRSFLGMASFYRKFIPNASAMTSGLSDLLKKGSPELLVWSASLRENFEALKSALVSPPILKLPDPQRTFVLRTDASQHSLGVVLIQYHGDMPWPVAYASRKLLDRECNYSTIERECLAIVYGIGKFRQYLLGREFVLETDHKPLVYLNKLKNSNSRLMRWALSLQPYMFRVVHIPGKDHVGPDFLSRID